MCEEKPKELKVSYPISPSRQRLLASIASGRKTISDRYHENGEPAYGRACRYIGCGKDFITSKRNKVYCSVECAEKMRNYLKYEYNKKRASTEQVKARMTARERETKERAREAKRMSEAIDAAKKYKEERTRLLIKKKRMDK